MDVDPKKIASQYKYCFRCGGKFVWKVGKLLVCQNCKLNYYIPPVLCNGGILKNEQGEILLVERKVDPGKGLWDVPGGFVDLNENIEESFIREIKEELNIDLSDFKYFCSVNDEYLYDGINFPTIGFLFSGNIGHQKIKVSDDVSSNKFFKPNEIPYENIAFEGVKKALIKFTKFKEKSASHH